MVALPRVSLLQIWFVAQRMAVPCVLGETWSLQLSQQLICHRIINEISGGTERLGMEPRPTSIVVCLDKAGQCRILRTGRGKGRAVLMTCISKSSLP